MGALTLAIAVPAGPSMPTGAASGFRASTAALADVETRSAADLREAARNLGFVAEIVVLPAHSDQAEFELQPVAELMRQRLRHFDRVLIAAHANLGGGGRLHATARACGLPVIGPDALAIGRAYDKLLARQVMRRHNIPVPRTVALGRDGNTPQIELARLGWPAVVKPRRGAGGSGVQRLTSAEQLATMPEIPGELLLEREVRGRELSVVVFAGRVLGIAELDRSFCLETNEPKTHAMICPADLDSRCEAGIANLALRACASLQLGEAPTRVDLLVSERDNEVVLEVEPLPPLHRDGVVARVARAAGLTYPRLCAELLTTAPVSRRTTSHSVWARA